MANSKEMSFPPSIDEVTQKEMSGIVTGMESIRVSVTNLVDEYMRLTEKIDKIMVELEELKKDNKEAKDNILQQQAQELIDKRKKLRLDLNTRMDNLEKRVETISSTTKKESVEMRALFTSYMTEELKKHKDDTQNSISKLEDSHKKELQALKELVEKDKKDQSEEISSLSRRLQLLEQLYRQEQYQSFTNIRRHSSRTQDHRKRLSLPVISLQSIEDDEMTDILIPLTIPNKQRHPSEASSGSDSGFSLFGDTTPEKEGHFEFGQQKLRRPSTAHDKPNFPGGLQEKVQIPPSIPDGNQKRPISTPTQRLRRSKTVPIRFPQFQ